MDVLSWTRSILDASNGALDRSDPDESLRLLDEALRYLAEMDATPEVRAEAEALLLRNRGRTWRQKGESRRALADCDAAAERLVLLYSRERLDLAFTLAQLHNNRANALTDLGDVDGAIEAYREAADALPPSDPAHPEWENSRAVILNNRGTALRMQGRLSEAVADFGQAIALREALREVLAPQGQWVPALRSDLAGTYMGRGTTLYCQGRLSDAVSDYGASIAMGETLREDIEKQGQWTPGLCNDLASAYMGRGIAIFAQGQLAEAVNDYGAAIALRQTLSEALAGPGQWSPWLRNDLAAAYVNRGHALRTLGRMAEAVADYAAAIGPGEALREALDARGQWAPALRNVLASAYMGRGTALRAQGQLAESVADQGAAIAIGEAMREALEDLGQWTPQLRNDLATAYSNRANGLSDQDRLAEAVTDYGAAIALREALRETLQRQAQWTPELANDLATVYSNRGTAFADQGRLVQAVDDYTAAIALREALREDLEGPGQWTPQLRSDLASSYNNRGVARRSQVHLDEAITDYGAAIALGEALRNELSGPGLWPSGLNNDLATAYVNRGTALSDQGRLAEAIADYEQAIALEEALREDLAGLEQWTPRSRNNWAAAYMHRGNALFAQGCLDDALADYEQAVAEVERFRDGILIETDRLRFLAYANLARLLDRLTDPAFWAREKSERMARLLEQLSPTSREQSHVPELYRNFALFHARWLSWCVRSGNVGLIPNILAIVQGREVAQELLDQLKGLEDPRTPEEVRAFQRLRLEIRKLNARIEAVIAGGRATGGPEGRGRTGLAANPAWDQAAYLKLEAEHRELVEQIPALRQAAAQVKGYEYLEAPYQRLGLQDLQRHLSPNEVLLLLIHPPEGEPGVMLVRREGAPYWQAVPQLPDLALAMRLFEGGNRAGRGYRTGPTAWQEERQRSEQGLKDRLGALGERLVTGLYEQERFWPALAEGLGQTLWSAVSAHLDGLERITAIPHGELHLLPLSAGAPAGLVIGRYPGLAFFAHRCGLYGEAPVAPTAGRGVGLIGFAGQYGDIPLTEAEAAALAGLHRSRGTPVYHPSAYPHQPEPIGLMHIACHGGEDPQHSERVALFLAKAPEVPADRDPSSPRGPGGVDLFDANAVDRKADSGHVLNQDAIVETPTPPRDLYFSACVGAQTREGLTGTPSGLISACFRRNARYVAGSLVSIPDQWAMLLALLVHQTLTREKLDLPVALAEGKRRLAEGAWYQDTGERLRAVLPGPMHRWAEIWVQTVWEYLAAEQRKRLWRAPDTVELRTWFPSGAIRSLEGNWSLSGDEVDDLFALLGHHGPETLAEPLAAALTELWPSRPRIPPEPALGTLVHGLVVFGENAG